MELVGRIRSLGYLVDIMVEGLRVENGCWYRIVLIVQVGEEIISPQTKLPMGPAPTGIGWIIHSLATDVGGGGSGRGSSVGIELEDSVEERKGKPRVKTGECEYLLESRRELGALAPI